jgi:hypothetical protein
MRLLFHQAGKRSNVIQMRMCHENGIHGVELDFLEQRKALSPDVFWVGSGVQYDSS